ncbi:hypothetical protein [Paraburkholderia caballeronis]|uniref:hypothetical protein n=1 Tax=Paraburkholderia caballeronis TaxID=416943 RepID=UPI00115FDBE4|nr:hypothetical protein [Paraburkholderia caballeronis]
MKKEPACHLIDIFRVESGRKTFARLHDFYGRITFFFFCVVRAYSRAMRGSAIAAPGIDRAGAAAPVQPFVFCSVSAR